MEAYKFGFDEARCKGCQEPVGILLLVKSSFSRLVYLGFGSPFFSFLSAAILLLHGTV